MSLISLVWLPDISWAAWPSFAFSAQAGTSVSLRAEGEATWCSPPCLHLLPPLGQAAWELWRLRARQPGRQAAWRWRNLGDSSLSWGGYIPSFGGSCSSVAHTGRASWSLWTVELEEPRKVAVLLLALHVLLPNSALTPWVPLLLFSLSLPLFPPEFTHLRDNTPYAQLSLLLSFPISFILLFKQAVSTVQF